MNNPKHISCAECRYAVIDKNASDYTRKRCKTCEAWENCEVCAGCNKSNDCKARKNRKNTQKCDRRVDTVCSRQVLKWAAIQCSNPDSVYVRSLLNVTPHGNKLNEITWGGCKWGVKS